jgi:hypothetical protein
LTWGVPPAPLGGLLWLFWWIGEDVVRLTGFFTRFRGIGVVGEEPTGFFLGVALTTGGVALLLLFGGDFRPVEAVDEDLDPVGDVLPEDVGDTLGLTFALWGLDLEVTEDLLGTAGGEEGGADLGGGGGGLLGCSSSKEGGGGEVKPRLFCDLSNCDFKAWKFLPDKVRVAGYFDGLLVLDTGLLVTELEGEAPFSKMEILSLMPLLGAGEVMLV